MSGDAFLKQAERSDARVKAIVALVAAIVALGAVIAGGIYIWMYPLALCRQQSSLLFFGTAIDRAGEIGHVDAGDWKGFVEAAILPRFPDGFTILDGRGFYRSSKSGDTVRESTHILMVMHPNTTDAHDRLAAIAKDYKIRFVQESVLHHSQCGIYRL